MTASNFSRFFFSVALSMVVMMGCGGSAEPPSSPPPEATTPNVVGVWNYDQVDATNVDIRADGTFRWSIEGCDFGGGGCGRWKTSEAGGIQLLPAKREEYFFWSHGETFRAEVVSATLTRSGDTMTLRGQLTSGEAFDQTWTSGRTCPICGGNLGPTGREACTTPLRDVCGN